MAESGAPTRRETARLPDRAPATPHAGTTDGGVVIERDLWQLLAVSAVVMGLAQTISREKLFEPLRDRLGGKETWLGYLVSCPYCASHWLAFAVVPLTGTYVVRVPWDLGPFDEILRWFFSSILVTVLAAFFRVGFWFMDEYQGLVKRRQKLIEEEIALDDLELREKERRGADRDHDQGHDQVQDRDDPSPPVH